MMIETVRVSEKAKTQLVTLKRRTGIQNWHTLCRWALLASLAEKAIPPFETIVTDSNIAIDWKTFAGPSSELIAAVLAERAHRDGVPEGSLPEFFKIHLHRGIAYLLNLQGDSTSVLAMTIR